MNFVSTAPALRRMTWVLIDWTKLLIQDKIDQIYLTSRAIPSPSVVPLPYILYSVVEWAVEDRPQLHNNVQYEARLNYLLPKYHNPVICTYNLTKFSAGTVMDILRTHLLVIIGGTLYENAFYVPLDQFLQDLRTRGG